MKRPSKSQIKAAVDKLKNKPEGTSKPSEPQAGKLSDQKNSQRIRKKGI